MKNAETRMVKLKTIMSSAAFKNGFEDYLREKPFRELSDKVAAWRYEYGRLFGSYWIREHPNAAIPKKGRLINKNNINGAIQSFGEAKREGCF